MEHSKVIVLIRGLMRDSRHWAGFDNMLRSKDVRVITVDVPGSGRLHHLPSPTSLQSYCPHLWQQVEAQLEADFGMDRAQHISVHLVGLSMGGMLALLLAQYRPARVSKVSVINSSAANLSPWYQRFKFSGLLSALTHNWVSSIKVPSHIAHFSRLEAYTLALVSHQHQHDVKLVEQWSRYRRRNTTSMGNGARQLYASAKFVAPAIECPVQVIVANNDKLVSANCSYALAQFYQAPLEEISDCGHDASLDYPNEVAQRLLN
ncbi:alpha/beta fold hydrolase [Shewanella maritima]|uniref:alpha/beta fold hydrolase n=1 Tax=Shewanella maritima TaxID=2520507 RepID=UPI003734D9E5